MAITLWKDRTYERTHRQLKFWVSPQDREEIEAECKRLGISRSEWLRKMLALSRAQRLSVAEDYVRMVIPEKVARRGEDACAVLGQAKWAEMERCRVPEDWERRRALKTEAKEYLDAAVWFKGPQDRYAAQRAGGAGAGPTTDAPGTPTVAGPSTAAKDAAPEDA